MKYKKLLLPGSIITVIILVLCIKPLLSKKPINVLLISMDTTRADRLGCYGYNKNSTPNIDSLALESIRFERVIAPIPFTFPSHLSIMTGTIPPFHGSHDNDGRKISDEHITIAEVLKEQGYKTGAILASYVLGKKFGLDQGFDSYDEFDEVAVNTIEFANGRRASDTARLANQYLEENKNKKFFLFTHFYDPHFPYDPPAEYVDRFKDDPYDGEIASMDHAIGQIIEKLKKLKIYDNTLIIVTADHGEMLGDHNEDGHGYYIYDGAVRVPLIIKLPGSNTSHSVSDTVGLIDIFPTICGVLGAEAPEFIQGIDLSAYLKGKGIDTKRYQFTESLTATKFGGNTLLGVVDDSYKYIQTTRPELYNLTEDPPELDNLIDEDPKRARLMQGNLKLILDTCAESGSVKKAEADLATVKQLESLGYIGGQVEASLSFDQSKPDPKDLKYIHKMYRDTMDAIVMFDWKRARILCDELLAERPHLDLANFMSARITIADVKAEPDEKIRYEKVADIYFALEKYDRAIEAWNEVIKLGVDTPQLRRKLAVANFHLNNLDEAVAQYQKSLERDPEQADIYVSLGKIALDSGNVDKALKHWTDSLKIDSAQPALHDEMAKLYYQQGRFDKVIEHCTEAVKLEPDNAQILNNLAWLLAAASDVSIRNSQKALEYALQACELTGYEKADYLDTLAVAYAADGQFSQAVKIAEKALERAIADGNENLVDEINKRLQLYKANEPYYD